MISIVVGFRNREIERVKRSLDSLANQTYTDFEIIFVDYGSDTSIATEIEKLLTSYKFIKYVFSDTRGWFWNRAHALNTGVKIASGNVILFFDIDLILESNFLQNLSTLSFETTYYTFTCFYLPERFAFYNDLMNRGVHCEQNYVGLCAINKDNFHKIGGFDEYFMVWGVEDDDFYNRLETIGIDRMQLGQPNFYLFHQWHKKQAPALPTMWYLEMVNYCYSKNRYKVENNISLKKNSEKFYNDFVFDLDVSVTYNKNLFIFHRLIKEFHNEKIKSIKYTYNFNQPSLYANILKNNNDQKVSYEEVSNFLQYFIGLNRNLLVDYNIRLEEFKIEIILIKK